MNDSLLFQMKPDQTDMPAVIVEGSHTPDSLASASATLRASDRQNFWAVTSM